MTNNDKPKEPRVWRLRYEYIPPDDGIENVEGPFTDGDVEVIEKSAYDALAEKLAEQTEQLEQLAAAQKNESELWDICARQKKENQRLRFALKKIKADFIPSGAKELELAIQEMRECAREALETEGEK